MPPRRILQVFPLCNDPRRMVLTRPSGSRTRSRTGRGSETREGIAAVVAGKMRTEIEIHLDEVERSLRN